MAQKIIKVGTSAAVTIPKGAMENLGLHVGDQVELEFDQAQRAVSIKPVVSLSERDKEVLSIALDVLERYREDFESLADR
ncbi:MAG: AbrB/MazE/SpoVT family DNA-binding domain-containing protein [Patescibacteria group bacterium]